MYKATRVQWGKVVTKQLEKIPSHVAKRFYLWVAAVEFSGLYLVRQNPGHHDEPLKGDREGQRSVRLNRAYRVIYTEAVDAHSIIVHVIEVNKHEY